MAAKQAKSNKATLIHTPAEQVHRIWLASLGVIAIFSKRGGEWFTRVVEEGKDLQERSTTFAREASTDLHAQATGIFAPITARIEKETARFEKQAAEYGAKLENGFEQLLGKLGIPSKRAVEELSREIAALTRKLKAAK